MTGLFSFTACGEIRLRSGLGQCQGPGACLAPSASVPKAWGVGGSGGGGEASFLEKAGGQEDPWNRTHAHCKSPCGQTPFYSLT